MEEEIPEADQEEEELSEQSQGVVRDSIKSPQLRDLNMSGESGRHSQPTGL